MKDTPNTASFIGYEYKSLTVNRRMESVYADGYQNFGWKLEDVSAPLTAGGALSMKFKRDRKIRNKAELTRLQRQFEACADEIVELERSKTVAASITAYIIGLIGTAFMAGSVFAVTAEPPRAALCAILAVPGFIGWILPYFCYRAIRRRKTNRLSPLIEKKYDELYDVCEKANGLLGGE